MVRVQSAPRIALELLHDGPVLDVVPRALKHALGGLRVGKQVLGLAADGQIMRTAADAYALSSMYSSAARYSSGMTPTISNDPSSLQAMLIGVKSRRVLAQR